MLSEISDFITIAQQESALSWYALADAAQHRDFPKKLRKIGRQVRCLFDAPQDSALASQAPHLVELESPLTCPDYWKWIAIQGKSKPCISVFATGQNFAAVFDHLVKFTQILMPDDEFMYLAFWDPAILGTLIGQEDDFTLYVKGPVLNSEQKNSFKSAIKHWWYWDRIGKLHFVADSTWQVPQAIFPLKLLQSQVDDLVEASVPDHILYYILLNQPMLLFNVEESRRYHLVKEALFNARHIGLLSMIDIVNFACLTLIYGSRMQEDKTICGLLDDVKNEKLAFSDVIDKMP
jgi:hypothetical protein